MGVDSATALPIAFSVIDGLAIILTLLRVAFRLRIGRFWWDDAWASLAVVCGAVFIVVQLMCFLTTNYEVSFVTRWILSYAFTSSMWSVRMSLLCAIIRIISPSTFLRKFSWAVVTLFILLWGAMIALKTWWCVNNLMAIADLGAVRSTCPVPRFYVLFKVTSDCISDAILVALPLKLLWRVKLPTRQRRMILLLFSSGVLMSICSLFHAITQLMPIESFEYIGTNLELALALIVCNLLVVVTYVYRVISSPLNQESTSSDSETKGSSSEDDDFTTPINNSQVLTTIDLESLGETTTEGASSFTRGVFSLFRSA